MFSSSPIKNSLIKMKSQSFDKNMMMYSTKLAISETTKIEFPTQLTHVLVLLVSFWNPKILKIYLLLQSLKTLESLMEIF